MEKYDYKTDRHGAYEIIYWRLEKLKAQPQAEFYILRYATQQKEQLLAIYV